MLHKTDLVNLYVTNKTDMTSLAINWCNFRKRNTQNEHMVVIEKKLTSQKVMKIIKETRINKSSEN